MRLLSALILALAASACSPTDAASSNEDLVATGCQEDGRLILRFLPPGTPLDWSSPNSIVRSALASSRAEAALVREGKAKAPHFIGHTLVELQCGPWSIPLTGQTGGGEEWKSIADGFGALFRDFPGTLNELPEGDAEATREDVRLREASGHLSRMVFRVNAAMCQRLSGYYAEYKRRRAYEHFTPVSRPRRFEGGGCATFGASFLEVGGLLRRSEYTPLWARSVLVGSARFSDFLGQGQYPYGSNLLARNTGTNWDAVIWPKGRAIRASTSDIIFPFERTLDRWTGSDDRPIRLVGSSASAAELQAQGIETPTAVPITLYDPQLMNDWTETMWSRIGGGAASTMGGVFTTGTTGAAHELVVDSTCVAPPTTPFDQDHDDLFVD